eukprot:COSAG01_NODE_960_length_12416_cov_3.072501_3_plen_560_part_00
MPRGPKQRKKQGSTPGRHQLDDNCHGDATSIKTDTPLLPWRLLLLGLLTFLAAALWWATRQPQEAASKSSARTQQYNFSNFAAARAQPVPAVEWGSQPLEEFPKISLAAWEKYQSPVVFRGVPLYQWAGVWDVMSRTPLQHLNDIMSTPVPESDQSRGATMRPKITSNSSFFENFDTFQQEHVWRRKWGMEPPATNNARDWDSPPEWLRHLLAGGGRDAGVHAYWLLNVEFYPSQVAAALKTAQPSATTLFGSPDLGKSGPLDSNAPLHDMMVNAWIASPGLANNMHYDAHWNYLVHARGPKRVLMAPPEDAWRVGVYPRLHPSRRSSPIDMRRPWDELVQEWPQLVAGEGARFLAVTLEAGDVLFIPPLWLHFIYVDGDDPSVTFSFFSNCAESELLRASAPPVPQHRAKAASIARAKAMVEAFFEHGDPSGTVAGKTSSPANVGELARRFVETHVLERSLRASNTTRALFCSHTPRKRRGLCGKSQDVAEFIRQRDSAAVAIGELVRDGWHQRHWHKEASAAVLLLTQIENIFMETWGPREACAALELCLLPALSDA